jgi:hypothetical protein
MRASVVLAGIVVVAAVSGACGGHPLPPARGVIEGSVGGGDWHFRRFQGPLLDVEVWIEGNKGVAYSASYVTADAEKRGKIADAELCSATVTKYDRDDGVTRATVKLVRRLAQEKGYQVDEDKLGGVRALKIVGPDEAWVMWPAKGYVVKVGGRGRADVPDAVLKSYGERYPSTLAGGALEGPLPPGPDDTPKGQGSDKPAYDPNNPHPDMDNYDPNKTKLPPKKDNGK